MRRFEHHGAREFWEVLQDGKSVSTRWGALGGPAQERVSTFPSIKEARLAYATLLQERLAAGYVEVQPPAPRQAEPLDAIETKRIGKPKLVKLEESIDTFEEALASLRRQAFLPSLKAGDSDRPLSKRGGLPWLEEGTRWPRCEEISAGEEGPRRPCGSALRFALQLNLAELPGRMRGQLGEGLLQIFTCERCLSGGDTYAILARVLSPKSRVKPLTPEAPPAEARLITGWREVEDEPERQEQAVQRLSERFPDIAGKLEGPEQGDKLGGWPRWYNLLRTPRAACRRCAKEMRFIFQAEALPFEGALSWIFQCPEHQDEVVLDWTCD